MQVVKTECKQFAEDAWDEVHLQSSVVGAKRGRRDEEMSMGASGFVPSKK